MEALKSPTNWMTLLGTFGVVSVDQLTNLSDRALICITVIVVAGLIARGMAVFGRDKARVEAAPVKIQPQDTLVAVPNAAGPVVTGPEEPKS